MMKIGIGIGMGFTPRAPVTSPVEDPQEDALKIVTTATVVPFDNLSGITILSWSGTSEPFIVGNKIRFAEDGTCFAVLLSNYTPSHIQVMESFKKRT